MFKHRAAVAVALTLGAIALTSASAESTTATGASSLDVMPALGGGIELYACQGVSADGPIEIVEFGRDAAGETSGVQLIVDGAPVDACAHLVVFTQPGPSQTLS
jgi:hypothetical protein